MKAKVSETGLEATPVNPFKLSIEPLHYSNFEANNQSYPLTEYQEPRSIIECEDELVWQVLHVLKEYGWRPVKDGETIGNLIELGRETRQALKPIPQPEKVKEEITEEQIKNIDLQIELQKSKDLMKAFFRKGIKDLTRCAELSIVMCDEIINETLTEYTNDENHDRVIFYTNVKKELQNFISLPTLEQAQINQALNNYH